MAGYPQMFEQALDVVRGPHESTSVLKILQIAPDVQHGDTALPPGRGVHINSNGQWEPGATGNQIPFLLWNGKDSLDVHISGISPVTGTTHYITYFPTGAATAFYTAGAFEFQTTEFDKDRTYAPNDPLTLDEDGFVTNENAVPYLNLICGFATWHENFPWKDDDPTGPVGKNSHGVVTLTFIGHFLPAVDLDDLNAALNAL